MTNPFNELPWHDAVLNELSISRRNPGKSDEICVLVSWPSHAVSRIVFSDCYAFTASMNFGVVAEESVRSAEERLDDNDLQELKNKWARLGVHLPDLRKFTIETNSTASSISIFCRAWRDEPLTHESSDLHAVE